MEIFQVKVVFRYIVPSSFVIFPNFSVHIIFNKLIFILCLEKATTSKFSSDASDALAQSSKHITHLPCHISSHIGNLQ